MLALRRTSRAFTLLEVLLAMALVAVVTASLYVSLYVAFRARRSATERLDTIRTARLAMDAISHDLWAALPPGGLLIQTFSGQDNVGPGGADADIISFYCANRASRTPDMGDVRQVTFTLIPETDVVTTIPPGNPGSSGSPGSPGILGSPAATGTRVTPSNAHPDRLVLVRQVQSNLLAPTPEDPVEEVLCRHVLGFNVRYLNGTVWTDSWDSTSNSNAVPNAIEVTLEIAPPDSADSPESLGGAKTSAKAGIQSYRLVRLFVPPCAPTGTSGTPAPAPGSGASQ